MFLIKHTIALLLLNFMTISDSARILAVIPTPCFSHQLFYRPLWKELSRKHQIVLLTTHPMNYNDSPNLTQIDLHEATNEWNLVQISQEFKDDQYQIMSNAADMMYKIIEYELSHPEVRKLIEDKDEHFDLLIVEDLVFDMLAFSVRFNCPYIGVVSLDAHTPRHEIMGNPVHPYLYPDFQLPVTPPLSFSERFKSLWFYIKGWILTQYQTTKRTDEVIRKYFGEGYPPVSEIAKNISLLFINTNPVFDIIRPLVPNTIQIGGATHIKPPKPLPMDIQTFLDEATEGAVYFSLGSNIKSNHLPEELKNVLIEAMTALPYKVLWKFEEDIEPKPDNVKQVKWCPQQDVLRHPNVKVFITHGGLHSVEEAIINQVPMVAMPFFMDCNKNAKRVVEKGVGVEVDKDTLTKDILVEKVKEVATSSFYKNNVKELSEVLLDHPMTGLEKAVWWIEYVIRHKGAKHLKKHEIPLYQYFFLDLVFCVCILLIAIVTVSKLLTKVRNCMKRKRKNRMSRRERFEYYQR